MIPTSARRLAWTPSSLTILVPALNEEKNLEPTVDRLLGALAITVQDFEILIVDDGSTDKTAEVAESLQQRHPQVRTLHNARNMGLGYCYLRGLNEAQKQSFVYIPGDNTWPYRSFVELFGNLGKADVITSYSTNPAARTPARRVVSAAYTRALNALFARRMHYYNGLTIYPLEFVRRHPPTTYGFGFQAEILLSALDAGLSVVEVAIPIDQRTAGESKAVTGRNIASVMATVARNYWRLRVQGRRPERRPMERSTPTTGSVEPRLRIVITGASSGIGAALVNALAEDSHELFICGRRREPLEAISGQCERVQANVCDISDEAQVLQLVGWLKQRTSAVDALINCAGTFGAIGPVEVTNSGEWLDTLKVNVFGSYLMIKHLLPLLRESPDARILNFSGGGAFSPFPNYSAYACSKAAIVRLTECLAAELAPEHVSVNAVAPGFVATPAHEATLAAGPELAGVLQYGRAKSILENGGGEMNTVVECVRMLLSAHSTGLTGKTISANFDPWQTASFRERLNDIARSDLWTMRRMNIINLPEGSLKDKLGEAWASFGTSR